MNVEHGRIEGAETAGEAAEWDQQIDAAVAKARLDPRFAHLFDPKEQEASLARALADVDAGRVYDHAVVSRWLETWGTPERKPFHEWLAQSGS